MAHDRHVTNYFSGLADCDAVWWWVSFSQANIVTLHIPESHSIGDDSICFTGRITSISLKRLVSFLNFQIS